MRAVALGSILIMLASSWGLAAAALSNRPQSVVGGEMDLHAIAAFVSIRESGRWNPDDAAADGRDPISKADDAMGQGDPGLLEPLDDAPGLRQGAEVQEAAREQLESPISNPLLEGLKVSGRESAGIRTIRLLEKNDPLGLLTKNEDGAWEVAAGKGDTFDEVVRAHERLTDDQLKGAMEATKHHPEFWSGGRAARFSGDEMPRFGKLFSDMRDFGIADRGDVSIIGETKGGNGPDAPESPSRIDLFDTDMQRLEFRTHTFDTPEADYDTMRGLNHEWDVAQMDSLRPVVDIGPNRYSGTYPTPSGAFYVPELTDFEGYAFFFKYWGPDHDLQDRKEGILVSGGSGVRTVNGKAGHTWTHGIPRTV